MATVYVGPTKRDRICNTDYAMTLEEVGRVFGVSRERIRQIEARALAKLKRYHMVDLLKMRELANELRARRGATCHTLSKHRDGRTPARGVIA